MANPQQYLEWHGQQWRVVVTIPRKLQDILGRTRFKHSLGTADLKAANDLKWPVVSRFKTLIAQARRAAASTNPHEADALKARLHADDEGVQYWIHEQAKRIEAKEGHNAAQSFYELASGETTPLSLHQDAFLSFKADYRLKTQGDFKRVVTWLEDWLQQTRKTATIEAVTRKAAGQFIEQHLCIGRSRDKASAYLGFLREYWKWLVQRGYCEDNPWTGQPLPAAPRAPRSAEPDTGKRPYTDDEVATLLYGPVTDLMRPPTSLYLRDLMHLAALSGMRLEEICQLRVSDCVGGTLSVRDGKTENARRGVPVHTGLHEIVKRLSENRPADAYLLTGLPDIPTSRDSRSDPASKAFSRYRRKLEVDERPNGKAKSNIDFHSFRRWFIRKARDAMQEPNAGFDAWTIADVVGHDDEGIKDLLKLTMRHYPGPSGDKAKRALVDAVALPPQPKQNHE